MEDGMKVLGVKVEAPHAKNYRLSMLIWGSSGSGKTTLASTMPGKKLLLNFEPDGYASITHAEDLLVADLAGGFDISAVKNAKNIFGLGQLVDEFDTVIVDSLTTISQMALERGIATTKNASVENPGIKGYGTRNALTLELVKNLLFFTRMNKKHICFIAHEGAPQMDDDGNISSQTFALGGQLPEAVAKDVSEVWHLGDSVDGKRKVISVRPFMKRKPIKTRMFKTSEGATFTWHYDPEERQGGTIEEWFNQWKDNQWKKIALPKK